MAPVELSPEQLAVVEHRASDLFVTACPGAGKTHTVVERFVRSWQQLPRCKGIAIVSFTRVAAREVQQRCQERGIIEALRFPNYVGTLDGFFIRYLYLPLAQAKVGKPLRVLDSWESLGALVQLSGPNAVKAAGVPLDAFPHDGQSCRFEPGRLPTRQRRQWTASIQSNLDSWERAATRRRAYLQSQGWRTCEDMRAALTKIGGRYQFVFKALAGRFDEVIVDEAQDCDADQIAGLRSIAEAGVRLTLVADVDQAIFGFRGADPGRLLDLVQARSMTELQIRGNRRGGTTICAVANSMVPESRAKTRPVGLTKEVDWPVCVLPYSRESRKARNAVGAAFRGRALQYGIDEVLVVAHVRNDAFSFAGRDAETGSVNLVEQIARGAIDLSHGDGEAKRAAIEAAEALILKRLGETTQNRMLLERAREALGLHRRNLRASAAALLRSVNEFRGERTTLTRAESAALTRSALDRIAAPSGLPWTRSSRQVAPDPAASQATDQTGPQRVEPGLSSVLANTVHGVKGEGVDAVLLALVGDSAGEILSAWRNRSMDSEASRVAYVGVTRAKRLLGLAVPQDLLQDLLDVLAERGVATELVPAAPVP